MFYKGYSAAMPSIRLNMHSAKGQGLVEYVMLLCIVVSAILIMQAYIKRSYQGRLKQEADSIGPQYAPKHSTSHTVSNTSLISETYSGGKTKAGGLGGSTALEVPLGMSVTFSQSLGTTTLKGAVDSFATEP